MSNIFDLTAARFSAKTALSLAQFSELAYKESDEVYAVLSDAGMKMSWLDRDYSDTQAFIASDDKIIVVCFRGTSSGKDALSDVKSRKFVPYAPPNPFAHVTTGPVFATPLLEGQVGEGFWGCWDSVAYEIKSEVDRRHGGEDHSKPILTCGHSLGGALAMICADQLSADDRTVRCYTFGQPRTFDATSAAGVAARLSGYHRFVNNNDVVPRVPFFGWGFRHAGRLNHFDHQGSLLLDPRPWIVTVDRIIGRIKDIGKWGTDGIKDHSMKTYVELVRGLS